MFNTSEDLPFQLRGGEDEQTAIYNRIAIINRVNYLVSKKILQFNLREKSPTYLKCVDLEMWKKFYHQEPKDKKADEEFCQRMAEICLGMEGLILPENVDQEYDAELNGYAHPNPPIIPDIPEKLSFFEKVLRKMGLQ